MTKNRAKKSIVYVATNSVNGHRYIGVTCGYLCQRRSKHKHLSLQKNSQTHFHRAIRKYGWDKFSFNIIKMCINFDVALTEEMKIISEVRPEYNMTKGGDGTLGFRPTPEQIERGAAKKRGKPGPWRNKELPKSFFSGRRRWNHSKRGRTSWAVCGAMGPKAMQRKVVCLDDGVEYESAKTAAAKYGVSPSMISSVCKRNGRHKTARGNVFRFYGEHQGGKEEAEAVRASVLFNRQRTAAIAREARL